MARTPLTSARSKPGQPLNRAGKMVPLNGFTKTVNYDLGEAPKMENGTVFGRSTKTVNYKSKQIII